MGCWREPQNLGRRKIKLALENPGVVAPEGTERPRKTVPGPRQAGHIGCGLQGRLGATRPGRPGPSGGCPYCADPVPTVGPSCPPRAWLVTAGGLVRAQEPGMRCGPWASGLFLHPSDRGRGPVVTPQGRCPPEPAARTGAPS